MLRQAGKAEPNLPRSATKLDKVCRLFRRYRQGAAAVEFAVVAPVFFLMVLAMIEYGRMVMVQQIITNGAREGARSAVLDGATTGSVTSSVGTYCTNGGVKNVVVTVTPDPPSNAASGDPVTVKVSVPFSQVSWLPSPMYLGATTLHASAVMRRESAN
jgi:Flp pilus assembly protein TadG